MALHLIKLSVGTESVEGLAEWQKLGASRSPDGYPRHVTRMWPKKEAELLAGGSVYWVIKGEVLARQKLVRFDEVIGGDGIRRCAFVLDPELVRTEVTRRRPFQGWRYLTDEDAPRDLPQARKGDDELPPELAEALAQIGLR